MTRLLGMKLVRHIFCFRGVGMKAKFINEYSEEDLDKLAVSLEAIVNTLAHTQLRRCRKHVEPPISRTPDLSI